MKDFVKYLGITIDSELSWKHHFNFICHKISRSLGIIAKMRHYIPRRLLLNLYPYLNFGICAWGNCPQTYLNKILVLQKRALHLIYFSKPSDHAIPFFIESNCLPLQSLFFQQLSYLMYDVHAKTAPKSLLDKVAKSNTKHHYNTRLYASPTLYKIGTLKDVAIFGSHLFYKFLMAIMTTTGAKMVLDLQLAPVPSRNMII